MSELEKHLEWQANIVRELGLFALRTLVTLNSGAFVVVLTFLGNSHVQVNFTISLNGLRISLILFLTSLAICLLLVVTNYVNAARQSQKNPLKRLSENIVTLNAIGTLCSTAVFLSGVLTLVLGVIENPSVT